MLGSPHRATRSTSRALLTVPVALVLALPACGGSSPRTTGPPLPPRRPADAPTSDLSASLTNAEAVAEYAPVLVVLSNGRNGVVDALDALAIPTLLLPAAETLEDSYEQLEIPQPRSSPRRR